jgi:hypothetical protein
MSNKAGGISLRMFIAGIVIAILASSTLSTVIATQFAGGPQGPPGGLGAPDYDSGWFPHASIRPLDITHNLGTKDVFVYMFGKNSNSETHQFRYGADHVLEDTGWEESTILRGYGAWWNTKDENTLRVFREESDTWWEEIRVLIWRIS